MNKEDRLAQMMADAALDEKAIDVVILDVRELTIIADFFVIASGRSTIQVKNIADGVEKKFAKEGILPVRREGHQEGKWIIVDFNSTILHVFRQEEREYYELENLWADAKRIDMAMF